VREPKSAKRTYLFALRGATLLTPFWFIRTTITKHGIPFGLSARCLPGVWMRAQMTCPAGKRLTVEADI